jgi:hypothetical protein
MASTTLVRPQLAPDPRAKPRTTGASDYNGPHFEIQTSPDAEPATIQPNAGDAELMKLSW